MSVGLAEPVPSRRSLMDCFCGVARSRAGLIDFSQLAGKSFLSRLLSGRLRDGAGGDEPVAEQPSVPFAALLRQLRTHAGLTQEELAEAATLSVRSVSDLERGINLTARRDTARLLADALKLTGPARAMFESAARGQAPPADNEADEHGTAAVPLASAMHALPRDTAGFTGRTSELGQLMNTLEDALSPPGMEVIGVHAIDGMAGIGKTAFAVHAAHLLAPRFPDGQFFLHLHSHTPGRQPADPATALGTLLLATGIATNHVPDGLDARAMMWRNGIAGKKILLVLDDAASHEQVRPLLPGTQGSLVLVTSRRRLAALEEAAPISLDTLPLADAAALFSRLIVRTIPETGAVAEITRLCGYLPLAIRLVAGTLRRHPSWTAEDVAAELTAAKDRLGAMRAENLSVAAAFDLSYQDLTPGQQRLFRRLGLHPGTTFDVGAAAALDATGLHEARRHLEDLYDHHLIAEPARGRYRLHDLLREHARSLAARDETEARGTAVVRLLDYYLHTAAAAHRLAARRASAAAPPVVGRPGVSLDLATRADAVTWLEAERENLCACTDHAAARPLPAHAIWLPAQIGEYLSTRGYWNQALAMHQTAHDMAQDTGDRAGQATAAYNLGYASYHSGRRYQEGIRSLSEAVSLYRALDDQPGLIDALNLLSTLQLYVDDYQAAAVSTGEALTLARQLGDQLGCADALFNLASLRDADGDYSAAIALLDQALAAYRDLGDQLHQAWVLNVEATVHRSTGNYRLAINTFTEAAALSRDIGDRVGYGLALTRIGAVHRMTGDYQEAAESLMLGLTELEELGEQHALAEALADLGALQHLTGDDQGAAASLDRALALSREVADRQAQAITLNHLGALLSTTASPAEGLARYTKALAIARDIGAVAEEADALAGIGQSHILVGDIPAGSNFLRQSLNIYQRIGSPNAKHVQAILDGQTA